MISVSLRDFSNKAEVPITSAANVITLSITTKRIFNHQTLELHYIRHRIMQHNHCRHSFNQYDMYSRPYSENDIVDQITKEHLDSEKRRTLVKLLAQRTDASNDTYFVDINRELHDYELLPRNLDDTDLLSKTSIRDLICIAELIDRIVSN